MSTRLVESLEGIVGASHVLVDNELTRQYTTDWTGRWSGSCTAVLRPGSTAEVSAVMAICAEHGIAVVPQGGNTGLVSGAVPQAPAVVVSTQRLDQLGSVDLLTGQITAGAGASLASLQNAAADAGWKFPIDFAARDTATVGGMVATNAGGHHVLRYGMTRSHVVGVEVVLADGRVISRMGGLLKDNTGYDLVGLMCGSEGTLGVITAARLALVPATPERIVALIGFTDIDSMVGAVGPLRRELPELEALELMVADGLARIAVHHRWTPPLGDAPVVVLVEVAGTEAATEQVAATVADLDGVVDAAVADSPTAAASLWRWRDAHAEVIAATGTTPPHKYDVTVPLRSIPSFIERVRQTIEIHAAGTVVWIFGHAGDGNLHVNVTGLAPDDTTIDGLVYELVKAFDGSISAEHGIGRAKRDWLAYSRTPNEIDVFRSVKAALDPQGILNPGVLLPD